MTAVSSRLRFPYFHRSGEDRSSLLDGALPTITQSGLIFPFFPTAGLQYRHFFPIRTYFQMDTRLFMGESFPPLERIPVLGEY